MADPKPWLSGFCNPGNPPDSHDRCTGSTTGGKGGAVLVCSCAHHTAPEPEVEPVVQGRKPRGIAGMSLAELQASIAAATQEVVR